MSEDFPTLDAAPDDPPLPAEAPSKAMALVKLFVGGVICLALVGGILADAYEGSGAAGGLGLLMGFFVGVVISGLANLAGTRTGKLFGLAVIVMVTALVAMVGPGVSRSFNEGQEKSFWTEHENDFVLATWKHDYPRKVKKPFRRKEYAYRLMLARAHSAASEKDVKKLRNVIRDIKKVPSGEQGNYDPALAKASESLKALYEEGLAKLSAGKGKQADEALRKAFRTVLHDLAAQETGQVYVAFTNSAILRKTQRAEQELERMRKVPAVLKVFPKGDAPVIAQGDAFSPRYDAKRRGTFLRAMKAGFAQIFGSKELFELVALPGNGPRKGKLVIEVNSRVVRANTYYTYTRGKQKKLAGFLFSMVVFWNFKIADRAGKELYKSPLLRSIPAQNISLRSKTGDPKWAPYSVMMDSAYYNYSRVVIARFGLKPPPERRVFSFQ